MDIDALVSEAVDTTRLQAQNSQIEIVVGGQPACRPWESRGSCHGPEKSAGQRHQLQHSGTKVAIATRLSGRRRRDQRHGSGMGIPESELNRVLNASTASIRPGHASLAAPGSGCPSSNTSPRITAVR